jgi:hypothetical protein
MDIKLTYKLINENSYHILNLTPEEYFDHKIGNKYKIDDVPKYIFVEEYLNFEVSEICFVKLNISNGLNYLVIESNFWSNGKNSSLKYLLYNKDESYVQEFLKINKLFVINNENFEESLSFYRNEIGMLELRSHVIFNNDGIIIDVIKDTNLRKFEKLGIQSI